MWGSERSGGENEEEQHWQVRMSRMNIPGLPQTVDKLEQDTAKAKHRMPVFAFAFALRHSAQNTAT